MAENIAQMMNMVSNGATKSAMLAAFNSFAEQQPSNSDIFNEGMTLGADLMFIGPNLETKLKYLGEDEHNALVKAMESGDNLAASKVKAEFTGKKELTITAHRRSLKPLLIEGRDLQPELIRRFRRSIGNPPPPASNVRSLLQTGKPYDGATTSALGEYFESLARPLEKK